MTGSKFPDDWLNAKREPLTLPVVFTPPKLLIPKLPAVTVLIGVPTLTFFKTIFLVVI